MINVNITCATTANTFTITVTGSYGIGSRGNDDARAIAAAVKEAYAQPEARHVILDLSKMDYQMGNAIGGIFQSQKYANLKIYLSKTCAEAWNSLPNYLDPLSVADVRKRIEFR